MLAVKKEVISGIYKKRPFTAHKYDYGHLLVVGGSRLYSGTLAFAALAALRSGCDVVTIFSVKRAADIAASFAPDLIAYPAYGEYLGIWHIFELIKYTNGKDAVVIGNGMGRRFFTRMLVRNYLRILIRNNIPVVVDADAIHAIAGHDFDFKGNAVITPHLGELKVLTGKNPKSFKDKVNAVKEIAKRYNAVVVLKGAIDIISDGKKVAIDKEGNPYLTKGGIGDILAGTCGALLARGVKPFDAARAAAYINGKAGNRVKHLKDSLIASDLLKALLYG